MDSEQRQPLLHKVSLTDARDDPHNGTSTGRKGLLTEGELRAQKDAINMKLSAPPFSQEALALEFAEKHPDMRFIAAWNKWFIFKGTHWQEDATREAFSRARVICREAARKANSANVAKSLASSQTRSAVISLASDDRRMAARVDQWDEDLWSLNTPEGTIDLRTGTTHPHRPEDYITKVTAVAPDPECPTALFDGFLDKVTRGDEDYKAFLRRVCGYCLTGSTEEHALFFVHGDGGNGKTVFMSTVMDIMGDYHRTAPMETFTDSKNERHSTELAMLRGARLVTATETEEGKGWAESKIKQLTGGEKISARFMRQDFFEFTPRFKLMISGNHKPTLKSADDAMRRRFNLLPFNVRIAPEERDPQLREKLKREWPGILSWMIKGCLEWQDRGLAPPPVVIEATATYLEDQDAITNWVEEQCERDVNAFTSLSDLFVAWQSWADVHGEHAGTSKRFSQKVEKLGFQRARAHGGVRGFRGIKGPFIGSSRLTVLRP